MNYNNLTNSNNYGTIACKTIKASKDITCNDISPNTLLGLPSSYYTGISENIQTQLNTLDNTTTNLQSLMNAGGSGGYFCIYGEIADLKTTTNNGFFQFGGSLLPQYRMGIFTPACTLISVCLHTTTAPSGTAPIVSIIKLLDGANNAGSGIVSTINMPIGTLLKKITTNVSFALGDAVNIQVTTSAGSVCGASRITLIFQTNGVTGVEGPTGPTGLVGPAGSNGISPILSIGTVNTGTASNATITGTQSNPLLNLTLVKGDQGTQGLQGPIGITPTITIGSVTKLASGTALPTCSISGTVLNFGLISGANGSDGSDGISPVLSIGSVSSLASENSATASLTGTSANPVLNLGLVQGIQGNKGDKGDTGSKADSTIEAIAAAGVATAAAGTAGGFAASAAQSASAAALSNANIGTRVAVLETKTQYQTTGTSLSAIPKTTFSLCDLVVSNGVNNQFQASFSDGAVSCGDITSGNISSGTIDCADIISTGNVKGKFIGDLDYESSTIQSTINIGQNSTNISNVTPNIINIGKTNDTININGTISKIKSSHIVGDLEYNNPSELSTINIGRNSTREFGLNAIYIGGVTDFIYINGTHFNPLTFLKTNYINQFT